MYRPRPAVLVHVLVLAGCLAGVLCGQDKVTTSPVGWDSKEGQDYAWLFGTYANARYQFADGEFRGGGTRQIKQVGYRHEYRSFDAYTGMGRTWSDVRLSLAECDFAKLSPIWTANPLTTPAQVFRGSVTWPSMNGFPSSQAPAPFVAALAFPFTTPFAYTGRNDLLLEYTFQGGKVDNSATWHTVIEHHYYLDSMRGVVSNNGSVTRFGSATCVDSSQAIAAYCLPTVATFAAYTGDPRNQNQHLFYSWSNRTAPGSPVIHAITLAGGGAGLPIPGACNRLFVDLTGPALYFSGNATNPVGSFSTIGALGYFPYTPSVVGTAVYAQAAWADSARGNLMLSLAGVAKVPSQPPDVPRRVANYDFRVNTATGFGFSADPRRNPIARLVYR